MNPIDKINILFINGNSIINIICQLIIDYNMDELEATLLVAETMGTKHEIKLYLN